VKKVVVKHKLKSSPKPAPTPVPKAVPKPAPKKSPFSKADLHKFQELLFNRRNTLRASMAQLEDETLKESRQNASGDLSNMPIHMADLGSDSYEQEFSLGLLENEQDELKQMEQAIIRIEKGTFGVCEGCGSIIGRERLKAIPYTKMCIECKRKQEGT
jgi:DnaK suppressor protein